MNDFYTCSNVQNNANSISCKVAFNEQHDIFKGHFPEQPVVPGVCMMEMVKELLQQQLGTALWLRNAGNIKFLQLITPDIQPEISITWKENDRGYTVDASFKSGENWLFKLGGSYELH